MKTTLLLATLAAGTLAISTGAFAQNFTAWSQSYGDAAAQSATNGRYVAPIDRFTRSDLGYQPRVTTARHDRRVRTQAEPAPAQEQ
jgi:hypothetical protein